MPSKPATNRGTLVSPPQTSAAARPPSAARPHSHNASRGARYTVTAGGYGKRR